MKFFKNIWQKIKRLFIKKKSKPTIVLYEEEKSIVEKGIYREEILENAKNAINEIQRNEILKPISDFENARSIIKVIEEQAEIRNEKQRNNKRKRLYEFYELNAELGSLEEKLTLLNFKNSQIKQADYPDTSFIDRRVDSLRILLDKNKNIDKVELSKISIPAFDKSLQELEKLLVDKSTLRSYTTRENVKRNQEQIYKNQIKQKLSELENFIIQNKLTEAKTLIDILSNDIMPSLQKELEMLTNAKEKYKVKEFQNYKKQEEELLKRQESVVKKIKDLVDHKRNLKLLERTKLIESETDYARKIINHTKSFNCNVILNLRKDYGLHDKLKRGVEILEGDKELRQYIYSVGNMHVAKLKSAFELLITPINFNHSNEQIEVFDWGCGQGLGSIALIDQLRIYKNKNEFISKITLIEPGIDALKRASLHASIALTSEIKINPINKYIGAELNDEDFLNKLHAIKFHIFSNIIDVNEVDADLITGLITEKMKGINYIICIGPRFGDSKDKKMEYFAKSFKICNGYEVISEREDGPGWKQKHKWTRKEIIIKINL
ncbi:MAG: hypothetical protein K9I26_03695 [Flavobacterium sp.]|nr:hypothetical protein [Flavobacterium sp.]